MAVCSLPPSVRLTGQDDNITEMLQHDLLRLTRFHADLCIIHILTILCLLAFPQEDLYLFFPFFSSLFILLKTRRADLGGCTQARTRGAVGGLNRDLCIRATVPSQSTVSRICPAQHTFMSSPPPHWAPLCDSVANSIGMATTSLVKAGTRCRGNVLVVPGR